MTAKQPKIMNAQAPKKVLVVGLGKTGLSCARYLSRAGHQVAVTDDRQDPPGFAALRDDLPDVALFLGRFEPDAFANAEQIVVSPGVSLKHPLIGEARARGVEIIGDIELFARAAKAPVIAITGSNGKSTVTTLVGEMARVAGVNAKVGGNLGTPALDLLPVDEVEPDLYVLELSSFQLESTFMLAARAAVILNISPDHLDRYSGVDDYAKAKQRIYRNAEIQIINLDDSYAARLADAQRTHIGFGVQPPSAGNDGAGNYGVRDVEGRSWLMRGGERLLPVDEIRMPGRHNLSNALAALALGDAAGLPREAMFETLRTFGGLPHRTQWVAEANGVVWYNDSKGTNIGATLAAVQGMDRPVVLIAGGQGKGADFRLLREGLEGRLRAVVLIGEDAPLIEAALQGMTTLVRADSMEAAVQAAAEQARPGDAVLLSPACASFDMFKGYDHRGDVFMDAVRRVVK
ncbi:MAG: UDP-N-acetylmuramoyl-L-alanine--D-glutamate ligase [Gammaproteobacteria bacterium]|nr:UDP-N-acetylmuramoyl-L-alanine--D-glutamate ligase [Gammaproteobacteria bacterium]